MTKTVVIDGKNFGMRASALTPRLYRAFFKRDMIRDMQNLIQAYNNLITLPEDATEEEKTEANLVILDYLEVFENVAWLFCKEAGESVGNSPEEWLDSIDGMFSIYEAMPTIIEMWVDNQIATSVPKNPEGRQ